MEVRHHLPPGPVTVFLALGSNLGDRKANLEKALQLLGERLSMERLSSLYESEPVGLKEQPLFLNAVCSVKTDIGPFQLLSLLKGVEVALGRVPGFPDAPRLIDLDILFYGNLVIKTDHLVIPHPRLEERAFVLIPLAEIAPDLIHPVSGRSIEDLLTSIKGRQGVKKIGQLNAKDM